jgi:hypothetical protein
MPQLPSGRQVALMPTPLNELLREGRQPGNIHKVLAIRTEADLWPYIDVLNLVPESEAVSRADETSLHAFSLPKPAGYRLSDWERQAADWSGEDRTAFREFLAGRAAPVLREYLETVQTGQAKLREAEDFLTRLLVGWWDAGCHPAQEEGWDASDVGPPDWDDYDLLAALGQACAQLAKQPELAGQWQAAARLQAFWNICRSELPQIDRMPDTARPVRDCALAMRNAGLLVPLDEGKRKWLHDQAVVECVELWKALGEGLRAAMPQPCGIIELVVVSAEANRYFESPERGGNDAEHPA